MKFKLDRFSLTAVDLEYDPTPYAVSAGNTDIQSFASYNKLVAKHDALSESNRLLIGSLTAEIVRLQNIAAALTNDVEREFASRSRTQSDQIVLTFISVHCRSNGLNMFMNILSVFVLQVYI